MLAAETVHQADDDSLRLYDPPATPGNGAEESRDGGGGCEADAARILQFHTSPRPSGRLRREAWRQQIRTTLPLLITDVAVTSGVLALAGLTPRGGGVDTPTMLLWASLTGLGLLGSTFYRGLGLPPVAELRSVARAGLGSAVIVALSATTFAERSVVATLFPLTLFSVLLAGLLPLARAAVRRRLADRSWWGMRAILVGDETATRSLKDHLDRHRHLGVVPITGGGPARHRAERERAPLAIAIDADDRRRAGLAMTFPVVMGTSPRCVRGDFVDPVGPLFAPERSGTLRTRCRWIKRAVDVVAAAAAIVAVAPVLVIVAAAVYAADPGPILYASRRVGRYGREFKMWKFRSMCVDADDRLRRLLAEDPDARVQWAAERKLRDDPRIVPGIGSLIRRTSIDELPQLWNVLVGEMSMVGPRPMPPDEIGLYGERFFEYTHVSPGVTGFWQVSGRNDLDFPTRVDMVRRYAADWSLWLDLWILIRTPAAVLGRGGAR